MPRFDGTGPDGIGPSGRGRGKCRLFNGMVRTHRGSALGGAFLTICGLAVQDAMNPTGLTRRAARSIGRSLRRRIAGRREHASATISEISKNL